MQTFAGAGLAHDTTRDRYRRAHFPAPDGVSAVLAEAVLEARRKSPGSRQTKLPVKISSFSRSSPPEPRNNGGGAGQCRDQNVGIDPRSADRIRAMETSQIMLKDLQKV